MLKKSMAELHTRGSDQALYRHMLLRGVLTVRRGRGMYALSGDGTHGDYDDDKGTRLIAKARIGDKGADAVLCDVAKRFIELGRPLPAKLGEFICSEKLRGPRSLSRGRPVLYRRDFDIYLALFKLTELGLHAKRNAETKKIESACSIVTQALKEVREDLLKAGANQKAVDRLALKEDAVNKIWDKRSAFQLLFYGR